MTNIREVVSENINGMTFIAMDTETTPKLKGGKANPYQGRVRKVMTGANVMVFQNKKSNGYDSMVKRRLEKEGKNADDFTIGPRSWGTRVDGIPFVEHKGNYYLEVIFLSSGEKHFTVDGKITPPSEIEGLIYDKQEGQQGGLSDKVIIRTFKVESITKLTINKRSYVDLEYK